MKADSAIEIAERIGVVAVLICAAASAATIGQSVTPPALTRERIAALPAGERAQWLAYLQRSERQRRVDRAALGAELQAAGMKGPTVPPSGSAARSVPLNRAAEWFGGAEARRIAAIVMSFQTPAGGWSKNMDMADHERRKGEHFAADNSSRYLAPGDFDTPHDAGWSYVGTIDNDATTTQLQFLARVASAAGEREGSAYRAAFVKGMRYLLAAQYPNGGWPQVYPLDGGYHDAVTFNDGAMIETLEVLRGVAGGQGIFAFTPAELRKESAKAVERGIDCILRAQVTVDGRLTVWGQQHDALTLRPVAARNYEPAALCGSESAGIVQFLMGLDRRDARTERAIAAAVAWFRKTEIRDVRYVRDREGGRLEAQQGSTVWARFYEIGTDRPIFGDRDRSIHDRLEDISLERRAGYSWYVTGPTGVLERVGRK